jgi:hypothetical protein
MRPDVGSIQLLACGGEWQSATQGAAAPAGAVAAQVLPKEGDDPRVGWLGQNGPRAGPTSGGNEVN